MGFRPITEDELADTAPSSGGGGTFRPITPDELAVESPAQPLNSSSQNLAGFFGDVLNKGTLGFGDEVAAGGSALIDALNYYTGISKIPDALGLSQDNVVRDLMAGAPLGEAYDQRLAQTRNAISGFQEDHPYVSAADNAAAFLTPVPSGIFSSAKGLVPALGNVAKGSALGAAYGGAAGFGSGEGGVENRLSGAGEGSLLGALLGGGLQTAAEGVQGTANFIGGLLPKARATQMLESAGGTKIRDITPSDLPDPFYRVRTLAEETQSPELASLQQALTDRSTAANAALMNNDLERRGLQSTLLESLSSQPSKNAETAGEEIRNILQKEADSRFTNAISQGVPLENQSRTIPVDDLRSSLNQIAQGEYQAGGLPRALNGVVGELNRPLKVGEELVQPAEQPFSYIQDLRERVNQAWTDLKSANDPKGARVADLMRRSIDDAIEAAPLRGGTFTADDVNAFKTSKQLYSDAASVFKEGKLGKSLQTQKADEYVSKGSQLIEKYFDGTPEGTRQLLSALPEKDAKALDIVRGAVRDHIRRSTVTNDELLAPETFRRYLRENKDALTASIGDIRLFEPEHIQTLEKIADDLGFLGRSVTSVRSMANRSSAGQSSTAQRLALQTATDWVGRLPGVRQGKELYNEAVDKVLTTALIKDKGFAQELLKPATTERVNALTKLIPGLSAISGENQTQSRTESQPLAQSQSTISKQSFATPTPKTTATQPKFYIDEALNRAEAKMTDNKLETPKLTGVKRTSGAKGGSPVDQAPPLVQAVIQTESSGNPKAISKAGAVGLMQLMPKTGAEWHDKLGLEGEYDPKDPVQNVQIGTAYLKHLLDVFDGDVKLALTAFNQGPTRVKNLLKATGGTTFEDIKDRLGPDGRAYAKKVLSKLTKLNGSIEV